MECTPVDADDEAAYIRGIVPDDEVTLGRHGDVDVIIAPLEQFELNSFEAACSVVGSRDRKTGACGSSTDDVVRMLSVASRGLLERATTGRVADEGAVLPTDRMCAFPACCFLH